MFGTKKMAVTTGKVRFQMSCVGKRAKRASMELSRDHTVHIQGFENVQDQVNEQDQKGMVHRHYNLCHPY